MFISTIQSMASLPAFQASPIDTVVVAFEGFSLRSEAKQPIDSLADWKAACEQHGLKMAVNALKLFMEEEVDGLEHFLQALKDVDVDAIYYADEGVFEIAQRLGLQEKLVYQPETLVTNTPDVCFYLDLGVKSVSLAHELSLEEIVGIVQNCPQAEILIHGYFSILYSRRPLVTNYLRHIGKEKKSDRYDLVEQTRDEAMPVLEDESGTHVFSAEPIQSLDYIQALYDAGVRRFRLDSLFLNDEEIIEAAKAYAAVLAGGQPARPLAGSDRWYGQTTVKKKVD